MDIEFRAIFLFPWIQGLDEINTFKNYLQEIRNMSNFQTWKEMMGFNSNWHMLCLSSWDSMVCIANSCRKYSENKEKISGQETIRSTQRLHVFKKATIFLLCIKLCVTNSFRDSICLKVRRASRVVTVSELSPCCWPFSLWSKAIMLLKYLHQKSYDMEKFLNSPYNPLSTYLYHGEPALCLPTVGSYPMKRVTPLVFPITRGKEASRRNCI